MVAGLFALTSSVAAADGAGELSGVAAFVESYKPLLPIPALAAILTIVWLFFRRTWQELDDESLRLRTESDEARQHDRRPFIALVLVAVILTMHEYYGGRSYFESAIAPRLAAWDGSGALKFTKYAELYGYTWWAGSRIGGYVLPFAVWKIFFKNDSVLDFGLRARGFFDHAWIYLLFLVVVLPAMLVVSHSPDFGTYYPFYKQSSRSWFDFLTWEAMYFLQFFALEMFFRGFFLGALRKSFGSGAIFAMAVPYCMIHFGKPYLEACGAIVAGIALGSLSMKTRSIYQGFMVHVTVAALMDWLSLRHRKATPLHFWPAEGPLPASKSWLLEEEQREALAHRIDVVAGVILASIFVLMVVMTLRRHRDILARLRRSRRRPA